MPEEIPPVGTGMPGELALPNEILALSILEDLPLPEDVFPLEFGMPDGLPIPSQIPPEGAGAPDDLPTPEDPPSDADALKFCDLPGLPLVVESAVAKVSCFVAETEEDNQEDLELL